MAKTISNLLVGIGFDLDKKSTDKVSSGIDNVKSKALKLGSVVAGAFGIKALTSDFANAKDDLGKFSDVMGVSANNVNAFGAALRLEGGTLGGFISQLEGIEKFRAGFKVGDIGFLPSAEKAGINTKTILEAKDATEAYLSLADQFQQLTKQQRINAAQAMGLDDASIRLLSRGRKAVEDVINAEKERRTITEAMLKVSAEFNDETQKLGDGIGGIADKISERALPHLNNLLKGMNDWIVANNKVINSGIDIFFDSIGENLIGIAASLGLISAAGGLGIAGKAVSKVGGKLGLGAVTKAGGLAAKTGGLASRAGGAGLALTAGLAIGDIISKNLSDEVNQAIGGAIAQVLASLGISEAQQAIQPRPIVIHSNLTMDGKVISKKVETVVGEMADQAIQNLSSTEGG